MVITLNSVVTIAEILKNNGLATEKSKISSCLLMSHLQKMVNCGYFPNQYCGMDEDQWTYDDTMSQKVDMDYENEQECGVNEPHVDCSDAFNTSKVMMFI